VATSGVDDEAVQHGGGDVGADERDASFVDG
jgi:hypothetical protein